MDLRIERARQKAREFWDKIATDPLRAFYYVRKLKYILGSVGLTHEYISVTKEQVNAALDYAWAHAKPYHALIPLPPRSPRD